DSLGHLFLLLRTCGRAAFFRLFQRFGLARGGSCWRLLQLSAGLKCQWVGCLRRIWWQILGRHRLGAPSLVQGESYAHTDGAQRYDSHESLRAFVIPAAIKALVVQTLPQRSNLLSDRS